MFDLKCETGYADNNPSPASLNSSASLNLVGTNIGRPFLEILVQPEASYRFRYDTEGGSHGCLKGQKGLNSKQGHKTYPTVKLNNFSEEAIIKCELYQCDNDKKHLHRLEDRKGERHRKVSTNNGYTVSFDGLWIKMDTQCSSRKVKNLDKGSKIDLNIVRLRISALDATTHQEICEPVFSEPIRHKTNPATNELKIKRYSRSCGSPRGGEEILMFVDKIPAGSRKIQVNFLEEGWAHDNGKWKETIPIMDYNVHRQSGIYFNTPPYKNKVLKKRVTVFIELERMNDGSRSEPREFTYLPSPLARSSKQQQWNSVQTNSSMMTPVSQNDTDSQDRFNIEELIDQGAVYPNTTASQRENFRFDTVASAMCGSINPDHRIRVSDPVLTNFDVSRSFVEPMETVSSELQNFSNFCEDLTPDVINEYGLNEDFELGPFHFYQMDQDFDLVSDSGRRASQWGECGTNSKNLLSLEGVSEAIKVLIQDISNFIKENFQKWFPDLILRLELLFGIKDSNGDTFLQKLLISHLPSFKRMVQVVSALRLYDLLNAVNDELRTVLHLAIINEMLEVVPFLIEKGCDPTVRDIYGFTAVHLAVKYPYSLEPLLNALIAKEDNEKLKLILNRSYGDLETPLHLAIELGRVECVKLLLDGGANPLGTMRDGFSTVHLTVLNNNVEILRMLLSYIPEDELERVVNQPLCLPYADRNANMTPLQIACDGHKVEIMQLLLENKACPYKTEDPHKPAWETAKQHPDMWAIMKHFVNDEQYEHFNNDTSDDDRDDDCDDESDDEVYFSADEGESKLESEDSTKLAAVTDWIMCHT